MNNHRNKILQWAEAGKLDQQTIQQAIDLAQAEPNKTQWLNFFKTGILWFAVISLSSAVIFYFAHNWQAMEHFTKFYLLEGIMLFSVLAYIRLASNRLLNSTILMSMSLLTGALLALVGQTYQTGADPWQLFASWALLIIPWCLIARNSALWILWAALINLSLFLYLDISHSFLGILISTETTLRVFSILNTLLLISFELSPVILNNLYVKNKVSNIKIFNGYYSSSNNRYVNQLLAFSSGVAITFLAFSSIFERKQNLIGLLFYFAWIVVAFYIYRFKTRDLFILSSGSLSLIIIITSLLAKLIEKQFTGNDFLLISFTIIILSTLAGLWLKKLSKEFNFTENQSGEK